MARRRDIDAGEAEWLDGLGRFDAARGWEADGQLSCAEWLTVYVGLARATAFDRVRVARQLRVRPVLAEALAAGRVSYCAVRAITRARDATTETDKALVRLAAEAGVAEVEAAVRAYLLYRSQDKPPPGWRTPRRGLRLRPVGDGMVRVDGFLTVDEAAELDAALAATRAQPDPGSQSSRGTDSQSSRETPDSPRSESSRGTGPGSSQDESSRGIESEDPGRVDEPAIDAGCSWPEKQADALMDLVRCGLGTWAGGADRYMVHVVTTVDADGCESSSRLLGGEVLAPETAARIRCDATTVAHEHDPEGVPLRLGRRRRGWSVHQRRAVLVRDGGHCRWPGCQRRHVDIHHLLPWERGGPTDVSNGLALCDRHHTSIHDGFAAVGNANGRLEFYRADSTHLGASTVTRPAVI